jgi:hypothetical protein
MSGIVCFCNLVTQSTHKIELRGGGEGKKRLLVLENLFIPATLFCGFKNFCRSPQQAPLGYIPEPHNQPAPITRSKS